MAEVTIRFRFNPQTGKRELIIGYESDRDALPHEHERDHRALAEALLGQPLGDDIGEVRVERVAKPSAAAADAAPDGAARAPEAVKRGA